MVATYFASLVSGGNSFFFKYPNQKHPKCNKSNGQDKKATLKKMWNQKGQPRPPAIDGIQIFDNDDQFTKCWETKNNVLQPGHH